MNNGPHQVRIENTGEVYTCAEDENLLRGMEVLGRRGIPVGCRGGGCGVCKVRVERGEYATRKMSRSCISVEEEADGVLLACRVFPRGDISVTVVGKMVRALGQCPPAMPTAAQQPPPLTISG
ncbi:MAG: 2Fe-2S iron-sulfur cluster binding domain-containing protein [Zoogloea sp.]|nr:2Fe-2S iron-sulfur cluster binding domain-containing protein [Zoogloea sp.]